MAGYDYGTPNESHIEQCKRLGILKESQCPACKQWKDKWNGYKCFCNNKQEAK